MIRTLADQGDHFSSFVVASGRAASFHYASASASASRPHPSSMCFSQTCFRSGLFAPVEPERQPNHTLFLTPSIQNNPLPPTATTRPCPADRRAPSGETDTPTAGIAAAEHWRVPVGRQTIVSDRNHPPLNRPHLLPPQFPIQPTPHLNQAEKGTNKRTSTYPAQ